MAVESFYISVNINQFDQKQLKEKENEFSMQKLNDNFVFNHCLLIEKTQGWYHVNACYFDFFENCVVLFELCNLFNEIKPCFEFEFLGCIYKFDFNDFMKFFVFISDLTQKYRDYFVEKYGRFSILPHNDFYKFFRKNKRKFRIK